MLYDCFPFFDELDLLELRLNTMNEIADYFVLIEATKTHTNRDKPLFFMGHKNRFEPFLHKMLYYCVTDYPTYTTPWLFENLQRDKIADVLAERTPAATDTIVLSDLDEIPNPDSIRPYIGVTGLFQLKMSFHCNYLNNRIKSTWNGGMLASYDYFSSCLDGVDYPQMVFIEPPTNRTTPSKLRMLKNNPTIPEILNGGWHFHGLGGTEAMRKKVFSSAFLYELNHDPKSIENKIFGDQVCQYDPDCLEVIDSRYPRYLLENPLKFAQHIHAGPYLLQTLHTQSGNLLPAG